MFRINKHLSASRLFNLKPLETCEKYAEQFKLFYKRLLTLNKKKSLTGNNSAIIVAQEYDYTVMYARVEDFEALYARYIAELKKKKIYCRRCKECGNAVLFYSRNKLLCDSCTAENISKSKREHKLIEKGDTVLRKNKERLGIYYNYSHSAAFRKSSPEHQKWFIDFFTRYKADAKALMKQYRAGKIEKNEALAQLSEMSKEYYEVVNIEDNKSSWLLHFNMLNSNYNKNCERSLLMEKIRQIWCEEDNRYYPEIKIENGRTYKLDEEKFVYLEQLDLGLTDEE